eukprot:1125945-Rhodomonas_salina.2
MHQTTGWTEVGYQRQVSAFSYHCKESTHTSRRSAMCFFLVPRRIMGTYTRLECLLKHVPADQKSEVRDERGTWQSARLTRHCDAWKHQINVLERISLCAAVRASNSLSAIAFFLP